MNFVDRVLRQVAPGVALNRVRARSALDAMMRYEAATPGQRGSSWRPVGSDADTASFAARERLAAVARDMIRNTAFATRLQMVIANNVVGDGIIPKVMAKSARDRKLLLEAIEAHCDTVAIDADGRQNLYGLQRLVMNAVVDAGEALVRFRPRDLSDGLPLPFQIQVLEPEFIDRTRDGTLTNGNKVQDGIEYDLIGRRVAYYLYTEHPGATFGLRRTWESRRVPASSVLHIYRQDRPGQMRGVSWYAPVALRLQDFADGQDAHLVRQKIAACFAAFRIAPEAEQPGFSGSDAASQDPAGLGTSIKPGRIQNMMPGEDIRFSSPPPVTGYDEFNRWVFRAVSADVGITYEALTNDFSGVNFSSARMGRMEMDRNVSGWQNLMMVPQLCQPLGAWIVQGWGLMQGRRPGRDVRLEWVPPQRMLVDPTREIPAIGEKVRLGLSSRSQEIRQLGYDPERVIEEIAEERAQDARLGLVFDSTAKAMPAPVAGAGQDSNRQGGDRQDEDSLDDRTQESGT